jgi:replicative DNA helicase
VDDDDPGFAGSFRQPPHNFEAEKALLGGLMANNNGLEDCERLEPDHFADPVHGRIYETIRRLIAGGNRADPITLHNYFAMDNSVADIGGTDYLAELAGSMVTGNLEGYAELITEMHTRRLLIQVGEDLVNSAYDHDIDANSTDMIVDAEAGLYDLANDQDPGDTELAFSGAAMDAMRELERAMAADGPVGIPTGLDGIDSLLGGLIKQNVYIIAGRPGMGKTALATNIAVHVAETVGEPSLFYSLEMSRTQLAQRVLAAKSGISSTDIIKGDITDEQFQTIYQHAQDSKAMSLVIDDHPSRSIASIRSRARRFKRRNGLALIVIDYLQLVEASNTRENRTQQIGEISRGVKALAKELDVPVILLSQLSRQVESRDNKRPVMSDLRESGDIEQDADVIGFVYREEYYAKKNRPIKDKREGKDAYEKRQLEWDDHLADIHGKAELIFDKHRQGPTGTVRLNFSDTTTTFSTPARRGEEEPPPAAPEDYGGLDIDGD